MDYFHNIVKTNGSNPKNQSPSSAKDDILDSVFLTIIRKFCCELLCNKPSQSSSFNSIPIIANKHTVTEKGRLAHCRPNKDLLNVIF